MQLYKLKQSTLVEIQHSLINFLLLVNISWYSSYWEYSRTPGPSTNITDLLQGQTQSPQHLLSSVSVFSASLMSLFIWSMPSSIRFSCSRRETSNLNKHGLIAGTSFSSIFIPRLMTFLFCLWGFFKIFIKDIQWVVFVY